MEQEKLKPIQGGHESLLQEKHLVLYNDDVNTFTHVIKVLTEVCQHDAEQAEQCALIAHLRGKCEVKDGTFYELKPIKDEMLRRELTATIE
jgi:ATP-dependent Clp protease adaptor protein ClpS